MILNAIIPAALKAGKWSSNFSPVKPFHRLFHTFTPNRIFCNINRTLNLVFKPNTNPVGSCYALAIL
mgnify:CR=1 FL=1